VPGVYDRAEENTENAIFAAVFDPDAWNDTTQWYVAQFRERYLKSPRGFDAEAFDASALIIAAFQRAQLHHGDRLSVCRAIQEEAGGERLTGLLSFSDVGHAQREVLLMTLEGNRIRLRRNEEDEVGLRNQGEDGRQ
jgi:ABC-type branched-subunit amino acid transport system substrate-binding protein